MNKKLTGTEWNKMTTEEQEDFAGGSMFLHNFEMDDNEIIIKIGYQTLLHKNGRKTLGVQFCDETCIYVEHVGIKNYISEQYDFNKKLHTVNEVIDYHFS